MNMQRILGLALFLFSALTFAVEPATPDEMIKHNTVELGKRAGNKQKIKDLIENKILPQFDFTRMTRLAVGRFWNQATPAQQQELTNEFRSLLVRTYSASLNTYRNQKIEYKPLRMNPVDTDVVVKTAIQQSSGRAIPIDYTVITGQCYGHLADEDDAAVAFLDWCPPRRADCKNRGVRRINDGGEFAHTVHAKVGDGEGAWTGIERHARRGKGRLAALVEVPGAPRAGGELVARPEALAQHILDAGVIEHHAQ